MTTPYTLQLADRLENGDASLRQVMLPAAAELRRLHALVQERASAGQVPNVTAGGPVYRPLDGLTHGATGDVVIRHKNQHHQIVPASSIEGEDQSKGLKELGFVEWFALGGGRNV